MKIKEILELTKTKTMAQIAKENLSIGEKPARRAMVHAGCYTIVGQSGWHFEDGEDQSVLQKTIYECHNEVIKLDKHFMNTLDSNTDLDFVPRKRHSFDLDVRVVKKLKLHCIKEDKTLYEVVEKAISDYLEKEEVE